MEIKCKEFRTSITLNVGGVIQTISRAFLNEISQLLPNSFFAMLNELSPQQIKTLKGNADFLYIDRNGKLFLTLYQFLEEVLSSGKRTSKSTSALSNGSTSPRKAVLPSPKVKLSPRTSPRQLGIDSDSSTNTAHLFSFNPSDSVQEQWLKYIEMFSLLKRFRLEQELTFYQLDFVIWSKPIEPKAVELLIINSNQISTRKGDSTKVIPPLANSGLKVVQFDQTDTPYIQHFLDPQVDLQKYQEQLIHLKGSITDNVVLIAALCPTFPAFVLFPQVESTLETPYWLTDTSATIVDALSTFRDIALHGLGALHRSNLFHSHLTPSKIYFTFDKHVQIAYFGDYCNWSPSEKLYRAPELEKNPTSRGSAADVFSWAMCIVTTFWPDTLKLSSLDHVLRYLKNQEEIPSPYGGNPTFSRNFQALLFDCLNRDPNKRPYILSSSFRDALNNLIFSYGLRKDEAAFFWKKNFTKSLETGHSATMEVVPEGEFFERFLRGLPRQRSAVFTKERMIHFLRAVLSDPWVNTENRVVKMVDFSRLFDTFGPFDEKFFSRLHDRFSVVAFFGLCTREYAENQLDSETYLIRLSASEWGIRGSYAYSIRSSEQKQFKHKRFLWSTGAQQFMLRGIDPPSLADYIRSVEDLSYFDPVRANFPFAVDFD